MKRVVHTGLGIGFILVGALLIAGFLAVLVRYHQLVALVGLGVGIVGIMIGALLMTRFAYDVVVDREGLLLRFVFFEKLVPWAEVEWYRKVGVTWGLEVVGSHLKAGIFTIVKCWRHTDGRRHAFRACLWTEGYGPGFSQASEEYVTVFDQYAPEKNWRRIKRGAPATRQSQPRIP